MAVLTPYQAQRDAIRRRLPDMEVSTVDGAQGREWDVVLYSTVRSNPQHRLGFLEDERRLNVAVTRARRNFILVGDERTLHDNAAFADLLASLEKVRLHYPPPPGNRPGPGQGGGRHGGRWEDRRGGRRDDRRGGGDRHDRGPPRDQRQHPRPEQQRTPQPPRQPQSFQDGEAVRDEDEGPAPTLPSGAVDPGLDGQGGRRRRRRRRRGRGMGVPQGEDVEPVQPPMPPLPEGPRPERRSYTIAPPSSAAAASDGRVEDALARPESRSSPGTAAEPASPATLEPEAKPGKPKRAAKPPAEPEPPASKPAKPAKKTATKPGKAVKPPKAAKPAKKAAAAKCAGETKSGEPCKLKPKPGTRYCAKHSA
jgi:hypothetical protein